MFSLKLKCLLVITYLQSVHLTPVSVESGTTLIDENSDHKNHNLFDVSSQKAVSQNNAAAGFNAENEKNHNIAQNTGLYNNQNENHKQHENVGSNFGENFQKQGGAAVSQIGNQGAQKKGHHKSGFTNSYHKEESENKNSFYDDKDDNGNHFVYDSRDGNFGQVGQNKNHGTFQDGALIAKDNIQKGRYDQGGNYGVTRGDKKDYDQQQYYNDRHDLGKSNVGNARGETGRRIENVYYNPLPIHQQLPVQQPLPIPRPLLPVQQPQYEPRYQPRQTITVYEDPRDYYAHNQYNRYQPQYNPQFNPQSEIQLDYKQNPIPYYPRQPAIDYYY